MFNICSPPRGLGLQNILKLTEIRGGRRICSGLLFDSSAPAERLSGVESSEVGSSSSRWSVWLLCFPFPASAFVIHLQVQLPPNDELMFVASLASPFHPFLDRSARRLALVHCVCVGRLFGWEGNSIC